ncbi:hypothetical protein CMV_000074 [Castanea mollissima]|uniref:Uncharacterized protein n=1 Tax=Castanea mollissima TaxID=60419 RepID=A0A8J4S5R4_9ROSI|nr:hypothetical protein CMV_000074 [Castanea mollissima]
MANHISAILPSGNFGNVDGFALANPNLIHNNHSFQSEVVAPSQPSFGAALASPQASVQGSLPQCPISQVQCEQLLNYLKIVTAANSGIGTPTAHQVATVMAYAPIIQPTLTPTSASASTDLPNFLDHPASSLFDSTLASSQLDSTIPTPTPPSVPLPSQSNSQPAASLELVLSNEPLPSPSSIDHSLPISSSSLPALRRSTRPHHAPTYLFYYSCKVVCTKPASGLPYDISNVISYSYLRAQFSSFIMAVNSIPTEPVCFSQAIGLDALTLGDL